MNPDEGFARLLVAVRDGLPYGRMMDRLCERAESSRYPSLASAWWTLLLRIVERRSRAVLWRRARRELRRSA